MTTPPSARRCPSRHSARTQRFTLGAPRAFALVAGRRSASLFLRSRRAPTGSAACGSSTSTAARNARRRPGALLGDGRGALPPRSGPGASAPREGAGGIVGYATDRDARVRGVRAVRPAVARRPRRRGDARELPAAGAGHRPAARPDRPPGRLRRRPAPCTSSTWTAPTTGARSQPERRRRRPGASRSSSRPRRWTATAASGGRPTAARLLAARVDEAPVQRWHIADPANPAPPGRGRLPGRRHAQRRRHACTCSPSTARAPTSTWDRAAFPYLVTRRWSAHGGAAAARADAATSAAPECWPSTRPPARPRCCARTPTVWLDVVPGVAGAGCPDGRLVTVADDGDGARRLVVDGEPVTPPDVQVRARSSTSTTRACCVAAHRRADRDATCGLVDARTARLRPPDRAGRCHSGRAAAATLAGRDRVARARRAPSVTRAPRRRARWPASRRTPRRRPSAPRVRAAAARRARAARRRCCCPRDHVPGRGALPGAAGPVRRPARTSEVLGPRATPSWSRSGWPTRASRSSSPTAAARRVAGRRGSARSRDDLAGAGARGPGRRAARARRRGAPGPRPAPRGDPRLVLRRLPGRARRAAPPGRLPRRRRRRAGDRLARCTTRTTPSATSATPTTTPEVYDAQLAARRRAHSSSGRCCSSTAWPTTTWWPRTRCGCPRALLAAGRPHTVLPLSGVTHMTPQEIVAENLLLLQLDFLQRALAL